MIAASPKYNYQPLKTELSVSISSIENSQKLFFEDLNDDNEGNDSQRIILDEKADIHFPNYYFENSKNHSSNNIKDEKFLNNNSFNNYFSTPKRIEKIELIPDVFNTSPTAHKNIMVSDLDIKLISTNKRNKKSNLNVLEEDKDLKKILEKNLKEYFERNCGVNKKNKLNNKNNNTIQINNHNNDKRNNFSFKNKNHNQKVINIKNSNFLTLTSGSMNKKKNNNNIFKSVPKKEKKMNFYFIIGNKNLNDKSLKKDSLKKNPSQKISNSNNSTNYSSSGTNKNNNYNNYIINHKITEFKVKDSIKNDNKTITKSTKRPITTLSLYKGETFFQTFCTTQSNTKSPFQTISQVNNSNDKKKNKTKMVKSIYELFGNKSLNRTIRTGNKCKLFNCDILNIQNPKKDVNSRNLNIYSCNTNNKKIKIIPISNNTMKLFEKKLNKQKLKNSNHGNLTENSMLFKGNKNFKFKKTSKPTKLIKTQ